MASLDDLEEITPITMVLPNGAEIHAGVYVDRVLSKHVLNLQALAGNLTRASGGAGGAGAEGDTDGEAEIEAMAAAKAEVAGFLTSVIDAWDFEEKRGTGVLVALTVDRLTQLGINALFTLMGALFEALQMSKGNGTRSPRRSSPTATRARKRS